MGFQQAAGRAVDSLFIRLGIPAIYTPAGGAPVAVTITRSQPDEIVDVVASRVHTATEIFQLRVAEVPNPQAGDSLQVGGDTFTIQGEPVRDQHGLVWRLEAYPQ
jgi:hypothetical protein